MLVVPLAAFAAAPMPLGHEEAPGLVTLVSSLVVSGPAARGARPSKGEEPRR